MENPPCEDAFPIEHGDFPMLCGLPEGRCPKINVKVLQMLKMYGTVPTYILPTFTINESQIVGEIFHTWGIWVSHFKLESYIMLGRA